MRWQRFFVTEKLGSTRSTLISSIPLLNQLKNVFRLRVGDKVILFDNSGYDFVAQILEYGKDTISFSIIDSKENKVLTKNEIYLFVSLVKKDNLEWIAEKATELGVSHIIPITSERSEKKDLNRERIQKIIIEAAEQSGRAVLPVLDEIMDLEGALSKYRKIKSIAWHTEAAKFVSQDLEGICGSYIGPEGGWSRAEIEMFEKNNLIVRSLGPQVLRSETAVIAALGRLVF